MAVAMKLSLCALGVSGGSLCSIAEFGLTEAEACLYMYSLILQSSSFPN